MTTAKPSPRVDLATPPTPGLVEPKPQAIRLGPERLLEAARALVAEQATPAPSAASAQRFLAAAAEHGLDLENTWGVVDQSGTVKHVALATPGSGRTHMVFTSPARTDIDAASLAVAIDASCRAVRTPGLAQALLDPGDATQADAFLRAEFTKLAVLGYLRKRNARARGRDLRAPTLPTGVTMDTWKPGMDPDFVAALEASYVDTLDCPELCGLRRTEDVLESHKAAGVFEPSLWWLIRHEGAPAGAMLFSPGHGAAHVELVYLGLAPSLRGMRIGRVLLDYGLRVVGERKEPAVTCAVDQRNEPARRLYRKAGFVQFAERAAYIRPV